MPRLNRLLPMVLIVALSFLATTPAHADSGGSNPTIVIPPSDVLSENPTLTCSGGCPIAPTGAFIGFPDGSGAFTVIAAAPPVTAAAATFPTLAETGVDDLAPIDAGGILLAAGFVLLFARRFSRARVREVTRGASFSRASVAPLLRSIAR